MLNPIGHRTRVKVEDSFRQKCLHDIVSNAIETTTAFRVVEGIMMQTDANQVCLHTINCVFRVTA